MFDVSIIITRYHGGPVYDEGPTGPGIKAISFNETKSCYVKIPKVDLRNINFTIALWVKVRTNNGHKQSLVNDWYNLPDNKVNFVFQLTTNLRLNFKRRDISAQNNIEVETTKALTLGQWHQVAVTWQRKPNVIKLFIDGKQEASRSFSSSFGEKVPSESFHIGDDDYSGNHQLDGSIADLYIMLGAMTAEQLAKLGGMTDHFELISKIIFQIKATVHTKCLFTKDICISSLVMDV